MISRHSFTNPRIFGDISWRLFDPAGMHLKMYIARNLQTWRSLKSHASNCTLFWKYPKERNTKINLPGAFQISSSLDSVAHLELNDKKMTRSISKLLSQCHISWVFFSFHWECSGTTLKPNCSRSIKENLSRQSYRPELEANIRSEPYPAYAEDAWRSCEVFFQQSAKRNVEMGLVKDLYACLLA